MTATYDRRATLARIDRRIENGLLNFIVRKSADEALRNIAAGHPDAVIDACGTTWESQHFIDFLLR